MKIGAGTERSLEREFANSEKEKRNAAERICKWELEIIKLSYGLLMVETGIHLSM